MSKRNVFLMALLLTLGSSSGAVLIDSGDGTGNDSAPSPDPGWRNIGVCNGLTVIYLGDGWVLSAAHVGEKTVAIDGGVYPPVVGSQVVLEHSESTHADLEVFRINPYPKHLRTLRLRSRAVQVQESVLMIGNGRSRGAPTRWKSPEVDDGYLWERPKRIRWGTNVVSGAGVDLAMFGRTTRSFYTDFTQAGTEHEAQATTGDSGGPVFTRKGAGWVIAGVLYATNGFVDQPAASSIYGSLTYAADISYYRDQILDVTTPSCGNGHLTVDEECDDGNMLAGDCCSEKCRFEPSASVCDDGLTCTTGSTCDSAGTCQPGIPVSCDDANACTEDRCDEDLGCRHAPIASLDCPG